MNREDMVQKILRGYGTIGNDFPINKAYPLFSDDIEQRAYDPDKAAFHFKKSGHDGAILLRTSDFDKTLIAARAELDPVKRKQMYRDMSVTVRDEGGVI
eukprot:gene30810-38495_t